MISRLLAMTRKPGLAIPLALALAVILAPGAQAQKEWKFGIGTGIQSFSLDGKIGIRTPGGGGIIFPDVDLDNSDTADMLNSAFGFGGFAAQGKWRILYKLGTAELEDNDGTLDAEWDKTSVDLAATYNFAKTGKHAWGALFGVRYIDHDWTFTTPTFKVDVDEDWTDALVGITHAFPFAQKWAWSNRLQYGFGGSEGSYLISSSVSRRFGKHWSASFNVQQDSIDFGDEDDIADSDFYRYDVDEPGVGIGFLYMW